MPNDHYISRFLTKPWEFGQKQLRYVDLEAGAIKTASSKRLFAKEGLNDAHTETQLGRLLENPVARSREDIASGALSDGLPWELRRAMVLLLSLQASRVYEAETGDQANGIATLLARPPKEIDAAVLEYEKRHALHSLHLPSSDFLCVPSSGIFMFPVHRASGYIEPAFGLPLTPAVLIAAIPHDADGGILLERVNRPGFFSCMSHGAGPSEKIVLPPLSIPDPGEESRLVEQARECRRSNDKIAQLLDGLAGQVAEARRIVFG